MAYIPALIAIAGGLVIPLWKKKRNIYVFAVVMVSAVMSLILCQQDWQGSALEITRTFGIRFRVDEISRVFLRLIDVLWPLAILYAFEYMQDEEHTGRFFLFYTVSFGVTQLLAMAGNLFTMYLMYETLTMVTLPLVTHEENMESLRAGVNYLKFTVGGAAMGLVALIVLGYYGAAGDFVPGGTAQSVPDAVARVVYTAAFIGFGAKAAIFPLCFWLPRASVAPTPVTALLHAVAVVNAGVFACIRLTYDCFGVEKMAGSWNQTFLILLSVFTILYGAVQAVREHHLKRRLAWSTVYNLSYMLFSCLLLSRDGLTGALTHMVNHGVIKITLFFAAGVFMKKAGAEYVTDLRGIGKRMPRTVAMFAIGAVALTGIPPLCGFISKWEIVTAAAEAGGWVEWVGITAVILSSVLACVYLIEPAFEMIFLPGKNETGRDPGWKMLLPMALLCAGMLVLGILPVWRMFDLSMY